MKTYPATFVILILLLLLSACKTVTKDKKASPAKATTELSCIEDTISGKAGDGPLQLDTILYNDYALISVIREWDFAKLPSPVYDLKQNCCVGYLEDFLPDSLNGFLHLHEIVPLTEDACAVIATFGYGDGGYYEGILCVGKWIPPFDIQMIHSMAYGGSMWPEDDSCGSWVHYQLNGDTLILRKECNNPPRKNELLDKKIINLKEL